MNSKENQVKRVNTLTEMMTEEIKEFFEKKAIYEAWEKKEPRDYYNYPYTPNAESLKRIMLLVRKETIKLEKLI